MIPEGYIIENKIRDKIKEVEEKHNVKFSTTQKILLSTTGPLTTILDVLYGEVNLFMLDQHFENADKRISELVNIPEGDKIDYRESIVHKNGRPLVYGLSYIPASRCNKAIIVDLLEEKLTIGRIIEKHEHETIRKINRISIEKATPTLKELFNTNEDMLTKEYTLIHDNNIIIWTKESYPLSYFKEK